MTTLGGVSSAGFKLFADRERDTGRESNPPTREIDFFPEIWRT